VRVVDEEAEAIERAEAEVAARAAEEAARKTQILSKVRAFSTAATIVASFFTLRTSHLVDMTSTLCD
jgi:hypothetical protein